MCRDYKWRAQWINVYIGEAHMLYTLRCARMCLHASNESEMTDIMVGICITYTALFIYLYTHIIIIVRRLHELHKHIQAESGEFSLSLSLYSRVLCVWMWMWMWLRLRIAKLCLRVSARKYVLVCARARERRNGKIGNQMGTMEATHIKHSRPAQMCKLCLVLCIVIVCNFCQLGSQCVCMYSASRQAVCCSCCWRCYIVSPKGRDYNPKKNVWAFRFRRRFVVVVVVIVIAFYISFLAPVWSFLFSGSQWMR